MIPDHRRPAAWLLWLLLLSLAASRVSAQSDGIFAEFKTSMGSFTCRLDYVVAPKAVANFIGLANGQRASVDLNTGLVRSNRFYDGQTFHRVIKGFMIQGGSPNGLGTDGPGYAFPDEFSASSRHDSPGVLSMANSGTDSNGSQYFVTVEPTPWLDDLHTIFGRVVGGMEVVTAINQVPTTSDKPVTDVVVQSVSIRRVGAAAEAFDINAQNLPIAQSVPLAIASAGGDVRLNFASQLYAENRLYASTDLKTWVDAGLGIDLKGPVLTSVTRPGTASSEYFRLAQVQYPGTTLAPRNVLGRTLTLNLSGAGTVTVTFDNSGGGAYTFPPNPAGTIPSYTWIQEPYAGRLWPIQYSGLVQMTIRLGFDSATAGTLTGTAYTVIPRSVSGTFTLSP